MRRKNKSKLVALILGIVLMGIGYAYLTANLKIKGTTNIGNNKWDIHFENAKVYDKSDTVTFESNSNSNLAQGIPNITGENDTELEWQVVLNQPGDYYYITSDIVNAGDIDAELDIDNSFVTFQVDGNEIKKSSFSEMNSSRFKPFIFVFRDDISFIEAGDSKNVIIGVALDTDIENEEWNSIKGKILNIKIDLKYKQADNHAGYSEGRMKIRVDNAVVNGHSDTITILNNSNSNLTPSITNKSIKYGTASDYTEYTEHTVDYSLIFNQPGDYYEFSANIISEEDYYSTLYDEKYTITIGDNIYDISNLNNVPEYFNYQVTTNDRVNSRSYNFLNRIETENITVRIELKNDLTFEQLAEIQGKVVNIKYLLHYHKYLGVL